MRTSCRALHLLLYALVPITIIAHHTLLPAGQQHRPPEVHICTTMQPVLHSTMASLHLVKCTLPIHAIHASSACMLGGSSEPQATCQHAHTVCLTLPLLISSWLRPGCHATGVSVDEVQQRARNIAQQPTPSPLKEVFTTKPGRDKAAAAQLMHGRLVFQPAMGLWGVVRFKGQQYHPHFFALDWVDGTVTDAVSSTVLRNRGWLQPEDAVLPPGTPNQPEPSPSVVTGRVSRRSARTRQARHT